MRKPGAVSALSCPVYVQLDVCLFCSVKDNYERHCAHFSSLCICIQ